MPSLEIYGDIKHQTRKKGKGQLRAAQLTPA